MTTRTNTAESVAIYAEDAVRKRIRRRWERRREETAGARLLRVVTYPEGIAQGREHVPPHWTQIAHEGDGAVVGSHPLLTIERARFRQKMQHASRNALILVRY